VKQLLHVLIYEITEQLKEQVCLKPYILMSAVSRSFQTKRIVSSDSTFSIMLTEFHRAFASGHKEFPAENG
jgi:hypothetical protein